MATSRMLCLSSTTVCGLGRTGRCRIRCSVITSMRSKKAPEVRDVHAPGAEVRSCVRRVCRYGAALTIAGMVQKLLSMAPILMYQHSRSGVSRPGR